MGSINLIDKYVCLRKKIIKNYILSNKVRIWSTSKCAIFIIYDKTSYTIYKFVIKICIEKYEVIFI